MATIDRIDEQEQLAAAIKKRRQPLAMAARTLPGGGIAPMADASHVLQPKPPTFGIGSYMKEAPQANPQAIPLAAAGMRPMQNVQALAPSMPNATAGQAQVRAVDNTIIAQQEQQAAAAQGQALAANPVNYATQGDGFLLRDTIRGGAAPGQPAQGRTTPGTQMQSDYGYGDVVTATADKTGRINQFSGTGGTGNQAAKPGIADLSAGLARAAANREQLAAIENERNALPLAAGTSQQGGRGDVRGAVGGRGDARLDGSQNIGGSIGDPRLGLETAKANAAVTADKAQARSLSAGIVDNAAAAPYRQAALAAGIGQAQAQTAGTQAKTAAEQAQTSAMQALQPGKVEGQTTSNAMAKLDLKGRQQVDDVMTKLGAASKPEDIGRLSTQLAGLLGKPKPESYDFKVAEVVGADGSKTPYLISINKATNKTEITPVGAKADPTEAMNAIKQAGGDQTKVAAIRARYLANGGDPAMLK